MIGCDVLEPDPEPRPQRRGTTVEEIQRCLDNLELWVAQAKDARVRAEAERLGLLDEESVKLLLRRP